MRDGRLMSTPKAWVVAGVLLLTFLLVVIATWPAQKDSTAKANAEQRAAIPTAATVPLGSVQRPSLVPSSAAVTSDASPKAQVQALFSSKEPLAGYMKLLRSRSSGSYGLSQEFYRYCRAAMGAAIKVVIDRTTPNEGEGPATARSPAMLRPEMMARREAAAQEINRRCEPLLQMGDGSQFQQGDPFATRRRDAISALVGNNPQALFGQSGVELAAQGLLHTLAEDVLADLDFKSIRHFEGRPMTTPDDLMAYKLALSWARVEINLGSQPSVDNLVVLLACAAGTSCDGDWRELDVQYMGASATAQGKARELLPRIKAALEANNLDAFRPPPKR